MNPQTQNNEQLKFQDYFNEKFLQKVDSEKLPENCREKNRMFLLDEQFDCSRFLFWNLFVGTFVPTPDGRDNLEKYKLLKENYFEKSEKFLNDLSQIESDDFENPLSREYKLCFEIETKNQIKIDVIRIGFLRDMIQQNSSLLFRVLYHWSIENPSIGYRQGYFKRNERTRRIHFLRR